MAERILAEAEKREIVPAYTPVTDPGVLAEAIADTAAVDSTYTWTPDALRLHVRDAAFRVLSRPPRAV
jgi:hypothetical protein